MVSILQFWMDEASIRDGVLFGGQVRSVNALAEYMKDSINPGLEEGYKVAWEWVVQCTPWIKKRLFNATSKEAKKIRQQPFLVTGILSDLEVAMEQCYDWEVLSLQLQKDKAAKEKPSAQSAHLMPKHHGCSTLSRMGHGQTLKLHLEKAVQGPNWTRVEPKDPGPDVWQWCEPPQWSDGIKNQASHSPLTDELLPPGENVTQVFDYDDDMQDQEIAEAIANIPCPDDVEMQDVNAPPGFEPEVGCTGYDPNLMQASKDTGLGSVSLVTAREDKTLDKDPQSRAPRMGRPDLGENPGCPITKKE